jgi:alcohol dehydrogenase
MAGMVAEIGPGVTRWRVGARVTVPFACGCGVCEYCRAGDAQVCPQQTQPGFTGPGSFAERVAIQSADVNLVARRWPSQHAGCAALMVVERVQHHVDTLAGVVQT